jgi:hypothetical protein
VWTQGFDLADDHALRGVAVMGVPKAPPGEGIVLVLSWCFAIALCLGALTALRWAPASARIVGDA